jgi:hypothetical protein
MWQRRPSNSGITVSSGMEEMPSQNMPVHRLKLAVLQLDLPCSGFETHSGEIPTICKLHNKKKDELFPKDIFVSFYHIFKLSNVLGISQFQWMI